MNKEEITITKEDLVQWLDRPPSNDDLDLCEFLANAVQNRQKYYEENQELKDRIDKVGKAIESEIKEAKKNNDLVTHCLSIQDLIDEKERFLKLLKGDKE